MEVPMARASIVDRMKGAALLDIATYEDVEADTTATTQAALVVVIVAVCGAIGGWGAAGGRGMIGGLIAAIASWLVWSAVTYLIGDKLLHGTATWGELLRTLGFAQTPGIFYIFGVVHFLGWLVWSVVGIWMLVTGVVAIRQALDFSTARAIVTALLGWLVIMVLRYALNAA